MLRAMAIEPSSRSSPSTIASSTRRPPRRAADCAASHRRASSSEYGEGTSVHFGISGSWHAATIAGPPFPRELEWINVPPLRMDQQLGRPVLIEFWDFCRPNSIRTLPYVRAWHERYGDDGLRVIGVHSPGFAPSFDPAAGRAAVARLDVTYPVVVDSDHEVWDLYGNQGWPARYLFDRTLTLVDYHYGEGAYDESERAIAELLDIEPPPFTPLRPEDAPGAALAPQTADQEGA